MKQYLKDIWTEEVKDGTINIGFTQQFIDQNMNECFHVIQADTKQVTKDGPLLVLETNSCLESIKAPITGHVHFFNQKALNFPDKLTEADVIITLSSTEKKKEVKPRQEVYQHIFEEWEAIQPVDMRNGIIQPQRPVGR